MKKTLLSFTALSLVTAASAQITITQNDIAPLYTRILQVNDTTPTVTPGNTGASQTWNFSAINNQTVDSLDFTLPQFTPSGSSFPGANLAVDDNNGQAYIYLNKSASELNIQGQSADPFGTGMMSLPYNNPETMIGFSSTYNSAFTDTATGYTQMYYGQDPGIGFTVDSFRIHMWIKKNSLVDAWGSLTDVVGTYPVIRQNVLRVEYDTVDIYAFGTWVPNFFSQQDSDRVYNFWANGVGYPVVTLTEAQDLGSVTAATYLLTTSQVGIAEQGNAAVISAYPNPAADVLHFEMKGINAASIEIVDVNGQLVSAQSISGTTAAVNVSELAAGMYFYRALDSKGLVLNRGKFNVAH